VRRVKTNKGWGHYPAAYPANGRVKSGVVIAVGREVKHKTRYYELRYHDGAHPVYEVLPGANPTEAEYKRKKKAAELAARVVAKNAGVQVVPADPQRKTLTEELKQFLSNAVGGDLLRWQRCISWPATNFCR
jgi:hypothetical protein